MDSSRITAVGANLPIPAGATVIDLGKATVLPGLIDCHTHITSGDPGDYYEGLFRRSPIDYAVAAPTFARRTLEAGFTSVRDVGSGEFIDGQALSPDGVWVRYDGEGRPPVTDGPFAETKDLIAGWMIIDVDSVERAHEAAAFLSSAPGPGGIPLNEWIEVRPFMSEPPTVTE